MNTFLLVIISICCFNIVCFSQDQSFPETPSDSLVIFYLENSQKQHQKILLRASNAYDIVYSEQLSDSTIDEVKHFVNGFFVQVDSSMTKFEINSEKIQTIYENGIKTNSNFYFDNYHSPDSTNIRKIHLNEIKYITYSSPLRNAVHAVGTVTITVSIIATLLFAPLISIDYQNGNFNQDRYYTIAALGFAGLAVSLPIASFSRPKTYHLHENKASKRSYWILRKKNVLPLYY